MNGPQIPQRKSRSNVDLFDQTLFPEVFETHEFKGRNVQSTALLGGSSHLASSYSSYWPHKKLAMVIYHLLTGMILQVGTWGHCYHPRFPKQFPPSSKIQAVSYVGLSTEVILVSAILLVMLLLVFAKIWVNGKTASNTTIKCRVEEGQHFQISGTKYLIKYWNQHVIWVDLETHIFPELILLIDATFGFFLRTQKVSFGSIFRLRTPWKTVGVHVLVSLEIFRWKLTCPLKINGCKMYSVLKESLFRGHVSFRGCIPWCCFRGLLFQKTYAEGLTFLRGQSCWISTKTTWWKNKDGCRHGPNTLIFFLVIPGTAALEIDVLKIQCGIYINTVIDACILC